MEINLPNGANVEEIVLPDGSNASEVIGPDGSTVWEGGAIPDEQDLQFHLIASSYDLNDGDTISSNWEDETENNHDFAPNGSPTFKTDQLNGEPAVLLDGSNDFFQNSDGITISQPFEFWVVAQLESTEVNNQDIHGASADVSGTAAMLRADGSVFTLFNGSSLSGPSEDTNPHIFGSVYDGSSSAIEVDGVETTGDAGDRSIDGDVEIGRNTTTEDLANAKVYELLAYVNRDDDRRSDIRDYLDSKYSIL